MYDVISTHKYVTTIYCTINLNAFATAELGETASYRDICYARDLMTVQHVLVPMPRALVCRGDNG